MTPTYFAELDENNVVVQVIVATQDVIDARKGRYVQTWMEGGPDKRHNYAGPGHVFDEEKGAFVAKQPYDSWALDEKNMQWKAPKEITDITKDVWSEERQDWVGK